LQFNKLQGSGKNVRCIPLQHILFFHAAATSFSDLSESSFVCFLAGLAGQVDVVCSVEPQYPHGGFFWGSNPNPVLYLFDLGRPCFFVIGGSPISAPATCEPEKSKQFQVARSNTHKLLEQGVQVARLNE